MKEMAKKFFKSITYDVLMMFLYFAVLYLLIEAAIVVNALFWVPVTLVSLVFILRSLWMVRRDRT